MKRKETPGTERLIAADPASAVTEEELARSRGKSLAAMDTDAEHITVGGSVTDFHQHPPRRRVRLMAGFGLVAAAAAAVVAGAVVTSSMTTPPTEQAAPAVSQLDPAPETASPSGVPLPEITGQMPTFEASIITGGNGNKAAVSIGKESDFHMDALNMGKLGLNSGGCFADVATDGSSSGLIFPFGTRVTETGVVFPDGTSLNIGDEFAFGGGLSPLHDVGGCSPTGSSFLVQSWDPLP
jgi:hypothetical protein